MAHTRFSLIIPAAGSGTRMGLAHNKLFLPLAGRPLLWHTLRAFTACPGLEEIILAVRPTDREGLLDLIGSQALPVSVRLAEGGETRQQSVHNALKLVSEASESVWVHDGARPFVTGGCLERLADALAMAPHAILGVPAKDTVKRVDASLRIAETLDRSALWLIQTPQCFTRTALVEAYERAEAEGYHGTDDASLMERYGYPVTVVPGDYFNIKITTPEDLVLGEAIMAHLKRS